MKLFLWIFFLCCNQTSVFDYGTQKRINLLKIALISWNLQLNWQQDSHVNTLEEIRRELSRSSYQASPIANNLDLFIADNDQDKWTLPASQLSDQANHLRQAPVLVASGAIIFMHSARSSFREPPGSLVNSDWQTHGGTGWHNKPECPCRRWRMWHVESQPRLPWKEAPKPMPKLSRTRRSKKSEIGLYPILVLTHVLGIQKLELPPDGSREPPRYLVG